MAESEKELRETNKQTEDLIEPDTLSDDELGKVSGGRRDTGDPASGVFYEKTRLQQGVD